MSTKHDHKCEGQDNRNPPVVTLMFMLYHALKMIGMKDMRNKTKQQMRNKIKVEVLTFTREWQEKNSLAVGVHFRAVT